MLTWGFLFVCILVALAIAAIFWLISHKFPAEWVKWANVIVAGIVIILLLIFIKNITGGNINWNTPIIR